MARGSVASVLGALLGSRRFRHLFDRDEEADLANHAADRIGHTVEIPDNPATRGMVRQVRFLVSVEEVPEAKASRTRAAAASEGAGTTPEDESK